MSSEEIVWSPVMIYFLEKGRRGGSWEILRERYMVFRGNGEGINRSQQSIKEEQ